MSFKASLQISRPQFDIHVEIAASAGEVTAIFGPSGCGKTSLLRAVAGLDSKATGTVEMNGEIWQNHTMFRPTHQRDIGFVFQEASLLPHLNVMQNIEYASKRQAKHKKRISLEHVINLLELSPLLKQSVENLSGGEKQRVCLARAIATSPALLLLDEPLAAVDTVHKQEILHYIQSLKNDFNIPMLYVSHAINEVAQLSDRLLLMEKGQVRAEGLTADLLSQTNLPFVAQQDAAAVFDTVVRKQEAHYGLSYLTFDSGQFIVTESDLAVQQRVRVQVLARDVSITLSQPAQSSILNIFPVTIESITPQGIAKQLLRLRIGQQILLSRITSKSLEDLSLRVGSQVFAQVKAVSLLN